MALQRAGKIAAGHAGNVTQGRGLWYFCCNRHALPVDNSVRQFFGAVAIDHHSARTK
jgi:hypothetical protein